MLAIHNQYVRFDLTKVAANAFAKLSKCQQFTTLYSSRIFLYKLQTLLQSYQNVSNSQRYIAHVFFYISCKRFCKVIKMLAIHNGSIYWYIGNYAANAFAKLSKCQQFTTRKNIMLSRRKLQTLLQSYQNVSNSQRHLPRLCNRICCKRFCKVIKMLAIHNALHYKFIHY